MHLNDNYIPNTQQHSLSPTINTKCIPNPLNPNQKTLSKTYLPFSPSQSANYISKLCFFLLLAQIHTSIHYSYSCWMYDVLHFYMYVQKNKLTTNVRYKFHSKDGSDGWIGCKLLYSLSHIHLFCEFAKMKEMYEHDNRITVIINCLFMMARNEIFSRKIVDMLS